MTPRTIRITEVRELLALIPHQIGFLPTESVVVVGIRARGRIGLIARVDLDEMADPGRGPAISRNLVTHLDLDGARDAVVIVYTDDDPRLSQGHPAAAALGHLRGAAEILRHVVAWAVTSTGYLDVDCTGPCCPPGGRALSDLESTKVGAQMVFSGSVVASSRQDAAQIAMANAADRRAVSRVRARWAVKGSEAARSGPAELEAWRMDTLAAWSDGVAHLTKNEETPRPLLGRVEAGLRDLRIRDAVLVSLLTGAEDDLQQMLLGEGLCTDAARQMESAVDRVYSRVSGTPPTSTSSLRARLLEQVVAHGRRGEQAPALTLLALMAWWSGDGARANVLLEKALVDDPEHRLAQLLWRTIAVGVAPGWVVSGQGGEHEMESSRRRRR